MPYTVANLPAVAKVRTYVDGKPYPARGANSFHYLYGCESRVIENVNDQSCTGTSGSPVLSATGALKVYDVSTHVPTGTKHSAVLMLLSEQDKALGSVVVRFELAYGGGTACAPTSEAGECGGHGVCHQGKCVCYDGWFGTTCTSSTSADATLCTRQHGNGRCQAEE